MKVYINKNYGDLEYVLGDSVLDRQPPSEKEVFQGLLVEMYGSNPERDVKIVYKLGQETLNDIGYTSQILVKDKDRWVPVMTIKA